MKKCPSSIWCQDSNSQPLEHESPPITTRPGLQSLADGAKTCLWCGRMILYLRAPIKIFCLNKRVFERFYWSSVSVWPDSDAIFGGHICIIWHSWSIEVSIDWFIDWFFVHSEHQCIHCTNRKCHWRVKRNVYFLHCINCYIWQSHLIVSEI